MEKERDLDVKMLVRFRGKFREALQAKTGWGRVELEKLVDDTMFDTILDTPDEELLRSETKEKMMATDITCPSCKHWWVDDDRFDEVDLEDAKADIEEKLATREQHLGEMREFLQSLVDEFDTTPGAYAVSRVFTKAEIQRMRRLVEE